MLFAKPDRRSPDDVPVGPYAMSALPRRIIFFISLSKGDDWRLKDSKKDNCWLLVYSRLCIIAPRVGRALVQMHRADGN